jgi:hypothetical protein
VFRRIVNPRGFFCPDALSQAWPISDGEMANAKRYVPARPRKDGEKVKGEKMEWRKVPVLLRMDARGPPTCMNGVEKNLGTPCFLKNPQTLNPPPCGCI